MKRPNSKTIGDFLLARVLVPNLQSCSASPIRNAPEYGQVAAFGTLGATKPVFSIDLAGLAVASLS